jgi:phage baseplate assembly protein W
MTTPSPVYRDFDIAFGLNPLTGDVPMKTNAAAVKYAIKSLVLTGHYEKPFHAEIGSPVKYMMFENMTDLAIITFRQQLADLIENYEPRVTLLDIVIKTAPDNNAIYISIIFRIKNTVQPEVVDIALNRTR